MIRMRAKFVTVRVATGRGVADRWASQYRISDGEWKNIVGPKTPRQVHEDLVHLGNNPPIDKVAEIIGNKSWSYISCDGCSDYVERAVSIGEYDEKSYCATCITEAFTVLAETEPMTAERAEEMTRRAT